MPKRSARKLAQFMLDEDGFRRWLRSYRKKHNLTLADIAAMTGIQPGRLSDIENGKTKGVRLRHLRAFAVALGYKRLADFIAEVE